MSEPDLPPGRAAPSGPGWFWRRPQRWFLLGIPIGALVAFLVGVGLTGGFVAALKQTETTSFCTSCHEMQQPLNELAHSVHGSNEFGIRATCADCHVPPTFWAGLWRHMKAADEVWGHITGELDTPAKFEAARPDLAKSVWAELKANDSAECRRCHTPAAMALDKQNPIAAQLHSTMAQTHRTCIDCHRGVAHTLPQGSSGS